MRAELRVRIGHVVRDARNIVRDVVEESGAHAHNLSNPIGRALRDLETLSCHTVFDLDVSTESYGRLLLGLESNTPLYTDNFDKTLKSLMYARVFYGLRLSFIGTK